MNNISNNVKITAPPTQAGREQDKVKDGAAEAQAPSSNASAAAANPEPAAPAPASTVIETREAAQDALQRLKDQLASQPSQALAAFQRITGQSVDNLLGSAVSTTS